MVRIRAKIGKKLCGRALVRIRAKVEKNTLFGWALARIRAIIEKKKHRYWQIFGKKRSKVEKKSFLVGNWLE